MEQFPGQKENEEILKILKKHPMFLLLKLSKALIILLVLILILYFSSSPIILIPVFIAFIADLSYGFYQWLNWYQEKYLITSLRIINFSHQGVFHKEVGEVYLYNLADATYEIKGALATMFRFGTVKILSATGFTLELQNVPSPQKIQNQIIQLKEAVEKESKKESQKEMIELLKEAK